jgi:hypothetical protein
LGIRHFARKDARKVTSFHGSDGLGVKIGHHAATDDTKSITAFFCH